MNNKEGKENSQLKAEYERKCLGMEKEIEIGMVEKKKKKMCMDVC
jgi:hypothetical protein